MAERGAEKARARVEITPEELVAISNAVRAQKVTKAERMAMRMKLGVREGATKVLQGAALAAALAAMWSVDLVVPGVGTGMSFYLKAIGASVAAGKTISGVGSIWKAFRMSTAEADELVARNRIDMYASRILQGKRTQQFALMFAEWQIKRAIKKAQREQKTASA